jgi:hypothetical protein
LRLFFDEDLGRGVAEALSAVHVPADWVGPSRTIEKGTPDSVWLPVAGKQGWLVISANRAILTTEAERELWARHRVGGVFLTTGRIRSIDLLRLILRKLDWLERIDLAQRPFAYFLSPSGRTSKVL